MFKFEKSKVSFNFTYNFDPRKNTEFQHCASYTFSDIFKVAARAKPKFEKTTCQVHHVFKKRLRHTHVVPQKSYFISQSVSNYVFLHKIGSFSCLHQIIIRSNDFLIQNPKILKFWKNIKESTSFMSQLKCQTKIRTRQDDNSYIISSAAFLIRSK